jgi:hypothetical protein
VNTETGELGERRLLHPEAAEQFLPGTQAAQCRHGGVDGILPVTHLAAAVQIGLWCPEICGCGLADIDLSNVSTKRRPAMQDIAEGRLFSASCAPRDRLQCLE